MNWDNKKQVREYHHKWYLNHKEQVLAKSKEWKEKNREKVIEGHRKYNLLNRSKLIDYYYNHREECDKRTKEYRNKNIIKIRKYHSDYMKKWRRTHKYIIKVHSLVQKIRIPTGTICEKCHLAIAKHKHHEDYSKPFEFKFICVRCHGLTRRKHA